MTKPSASAWRLAPLLLAAVLAACSKPQPAPEPVRSVKVLTVGATAWSSAHEFAGEVRPRVESRLGFRVAGKIVQRHAEPGQRVQPGQVLAQLDARDYRLAADAARAQVAAAATQRDLAFADFKRFAALEDQNFISGAELQRREASLKAAQAQLEQAQAQLASQSNQAGYTSLSADAAGVITGVEAEPGQVVGAGSPVVRIARDGPRDVLFSVPEDKVTAIRPGSPVGVRLWSGGGAIEAEVREVAASADPVTRTYAVKVSLPADAQPPLGSTAYVSPQALAHAGTAVIKLPTSALRQEGQGSAVWVLDRATMTLRSQPVQVATADGNEAVIAAGLQPGMLVVSAGVHVLAAGQKVRIYEERPVAASAPAPAQPALAAAVQPVAAR
ncbi:efflux RND transporter periplasmic adaptor subunit [Ramlibacter sp.]|uniref:efflux RND transporter periplasmic adaptor subunit n=1 Tax=Ramlibacter sp. TaxID=1917967 RepID=UPI002FCBD429